MKQQLLNYKIEIHVFRQMFELSVEATIRGSPTAIKVSHFVKEDSGPRIPSKRFQLSVEGPDYF
jgi:hypothetical protein